MVEGDNETKLKICRLCHVHFDSLEQKFCGNGCQKKEPFSGNGKSGEDYEPRVVIIEKYENYKEKIRWMCNFCHEDFEESLLVDKGFICPNCGKENDFYPFTEKKCSICKDTNDAGKESPRKLPIWAKACEKCGKKEFIINKSKNVKDLITIHGKEVEDSWEGPSEVFKMSNEVKVQRETKNLISCTFTLLNSNLNYVLFAEEKEITLIDLIRDGMGYLPDSVYDALLKKFSKKTPLFEIHFKKDGDQEKFYLKSVFSVKLRKLNAQFFPEGDIKSMGENTLIELPENTLLLAEVNVLKKMDLKIHIWVY